MAGDYGYAYDPIGNRLSYYPAGANTVYYCANSLNQYTTTDDAATCPPSTPAQSFAHDEDGNLVYEEGGSLATPPAYVYDADNRLIQVGPAGSPAVGDRRVTFTYDYRGRRVKQVGETWSGSGWISELRLSVWDGWKMLLERRLAQYGQPPPTRAYTWGLDLAGQRASGRGGRTSPRSLLEGAGTIGGLLAVADGTGGAGTLTYVYCYDANGNVGQVVDPAAANVTAALVATYEYDPYGGVVTSAGSYAATNPVRFSTKYWDDATGLGYWGYRFYRADLGRWVNRDPIEERGGRNLLGYVLNHPTLAWDARGLSSATLPIGPCMSTPEDCEREHGECYSGWEVTSNYECHCRQKCPPRFPQMPATPRPPRTKIDWDIVGDCTRVTWPAAEQQPVNCHAWAFGGECVYLPVVGVPYPSPPDKHWYEIPCPADIATSTERPDGPCKDGTHFVFQMSTNPEYLMEGAGHSIVYTCDAYGECGYYQKCGADPTTGPFATIAEAAGACNPPMPVPTDGRETRCMCVE